MADFLTITDVKARKPHRCRDCHKQIDAGILYKNIVGVWEGDFFAFKSHPECHAAHQDYNVNVLESRYGDEWYDLSEIEVDSWRWLLATHPIAAERLGVAAWIEDYESESGRQVP